MILAHAGAEPTRRTAYSARIRRYAESTLTMDIVHHTFIGGTAFLALAANEQELAGMAFVAGSVFPDLDVVFMAFGKRAYLKNHQGPTHSFLLAPVFAYVFIAGPLCLPFGFDWAVFVAALRGLWLHSLLDLTNTFGITVFWPVSARRFCFDAVFFIDTVAWTLTAGCYVAEVIFSWPYAIGCYAVLFASYVLFKLFLHIVVQRKLDCRFAIPSAFHPFHYFVLEESDVGIRTYIFNALTGSISRDENYPPVQSRYREMASKSAVYQDMLLLTKYFYVTGIEEGGDRLVLTLHDLGIRNFGGKFGKTVLTFDGAGNLVDEMAHI